MGAMGAILKKSSILQEGNAFHFPFTIRKVIIGRFSNSKWAKTRFPRGQDPILSTQTSSAAEIGILSTQRIPRGRDPILSTQRIGGSWGAMRLKIRFSQGKVAFGALPVLARFYPGGDLV